MGKHWSKGWSNDTGLIKSDYYDGRPGTVRYEIQIWKVTRAIEIIGTAKFGVPTEFDYHVFLAMLALQSKGWKNPIFIVSITDIINILWISDGWRSYRDIADSIERLSTTTYQIDNIFQRKAEPWKSKSFLPDMTEEELLEYEEFTSSVKDFSDKEIITEVEIGTDHNINIKQRAFTHIKLFDMELWMQEAKESTGEILKWQYVIRFSDFMRNGISEKYFFFIDANKLLELRSGPLKRFYEIIQFQSNKRRFVTFEYNRLALMIPLNSGRMNKTYIIKYAQELLDLAYIAWFNIAKDKKSISIEFLTGESVDNAIPPALLGDTETVNQLKLGIREILNKKKISHISVDEIYELINMPGVNKLKLSTSAILGNLWYTLRARKWEAIESIIGYLRLSIGGDWYGDYMRKKTKKIEVSKSQISIKLAETIGEATKSGWEKEMRKEIFEQYISGLTEDELEEKFELYWVRKNINDNTRKHDLRLKLFKAWVLSMEH